MRATLLIPERLGVCFPGLSSFFADGGVCTTAGAELVDTEVAIAGLVVIGVAAAGE